MSVQHLPKTCPRCYSDMELEFQRNTQQGQEGEAWFWVCVSPTCDYYEQDKNDYEPEYHED
jgi:DNA-directed RNA polymerase subunit M/transcription elongation factor TFIIS